MLRDIDADGHVRALRDPTTGEPFIVPCCPRCFAPLKDETRAERAERRDRGRKRASHSGRAAGRQDGEDRGDGADGDDEETLAVYLTEAELLGRRCPLAKHTCAACGEPLWQVRPDGAKEWRATPPPLAGGHRRVDPLPLPDRDTHPPSVTCVTSTWDRRYPIADYLRKRHRGLFRTLIADEAH